MGDGRGRAGRVHSLFEKLLSLLLTATLILEGFPITAYASGLSADEASDVVAAQVMEGESEVGSEMLAPEVDAAAEAGLDGQAAIDGGAADAEVASEPDLGNVASIGETTEVEEVVETVVSEGEAAAEIEPVDGDMAVDAESAESAELVVEDAAVDAETVEEADGVVAQVLAKEPTTNAQSVGDTILTAQAIDMSTYMTRMNAFINDSRWAHGTYWPQRALKLSTYNCSGCFAYACDFTAYVYGINNYQEGQAFWSASKIRTGDVIRISGHTFVVLERNGNDLYTERRATPSLGNKCGGLFSSPFYRLLSGYCVVATSYVVS